MSLFMAFYFMPKATFLKGRNPLKKNASVIRDQFADTY